MSTTLQNKASSFVAPPCYDCKIFAGVASIILNDPMADSLANALRRSELKHPFLETIRAELIGNDPSEEYDGEHDGPAYSYSYFRSCGLLFLNAAGSELLAQAIFMSGGGKANSRPVPRHLWSLHYALKNMIETSGQVDYRFFYGVHIVTLTDLFGETLSSAIDRSEIKHDTLALISQELGGLEVQDEDVEDGMDMIPAFSYTHFGECGTLLLNRAASGLLSQSIVMSGHGRPVPEHLLELSRWLKDGPNASCLATEKRA